MKFFALTLLFLGLVVTSHARTVEASGGNSIVDPFSIAFDAHGNLFGVEYVRSNRVFKIDPFGVISKVAGIQSVTNQKMGDLGSRDGSDPMTAHFNGMHDLAIGSDGSIYLTDTFNARVRKLDKATGKLTTIIGTGVTGFSGDGGRSHKAQVAQVHSLSFNEDKTRLYFTDLPNRRIRMLDIATGFVSTVVGTGEKAVPIDGTAALKAPLLDPPSSSGRYG